MPRLVDRDGARTPRGIIRRCRNHGPMLNAGDQLLVKLRIPLAMRPRCAEILAITDELCAAHLDSEYADLCRELIARLARKRPSPLARGEARIWAAGAVYALGQINFLFDRSQQPHLSADQLARFLGVVKTTMANKAAAIRRTLDLTYYEPGLTRHELLDDHPLAWIVSVNGFLVDARTLPAELQDEARRRGLIPDLQTRHAA